MMHNYYFKMYLYESHDPSYFLSKTHAISFDCKKVIALIDTFWTKFIATQKFRRKIKLKHSIKLIEGQIKIVNMKLSRRINA